MSSPLKVQERNSSRMAQGTNNSGKSIVPRPSIRLKDIRNPRIRVKTKQELAVSRSNSRTAKPNSRSSPPHRHPSPPKYQHHEFTTTSDGHFSSAQKNHLMNFLKELQLESFYNVFIQNQITVEDVPLLSNEDISDLKLPIGPRNRLLHVISEINQTSPNESVSEPAEDFEESLQEPSMLRDMQSTGHFGMFSVDEKYNQIQEMLYQISQQQLQMMQVIEQNQRAIQKLTMDTIRRPQSVAREERENEGGMQETQESERRGEIGQKNIDNAIKCIQRAAKPRYGAPLRPVNH